MGCDYYIEIYLEIEHNNGVSFYEFPTLRGFFCDLEMYWVYDSDDEDNNFYDSPDYKLLYENMRKLCLTPKKPIVIYENNSFTQPKFENKYLPIIQELLNKDNKINKYARYVDTGTFTNMEQIIKITKKEDRYERI